MDMIMYFRGGLADIHHERNRARKAVDDRDLDELNKALSNMETNITEMRAEVAHQMSRRK